MSKIKIMHILKSVGGVNVALNLIVENINSSEFDSVIVHSSNDSQKLFKDKEGIVLKSFPINIVREINIVKDIIAIYQASKIVIKEKPHLIHAHSAKGGLIGRVASIFYPVKVLYTPHAFSYLSADNKLKKEIILFIEKILKNCNSILLAISKSEMIRGIEDVGFKKNKVEHWNNSILPVKMENENIKELDDIPNDFICTVGRPSYQKNIEFMIEVIYLVKQKLPKIHLVLMGVGEYSPNLNNVKKKIIEYNLQSNITLIPWIERTKILKIMNKTKLYISTSRYEGLPYSIIEALALSKACVVTDCDGNRDLVKDMYNGFLVDQDERELMANKIILLLQNDSLRYKMENNAYQLFLEKFDLRKNIFKLEEIYNKYASIN